MNGNEDATIAKKNGIKGREEGAGADVSLAMALRTLPPPPGERFVILSLLGDIHAVVLDLAIDLAVANSKRTADAHHLHHSLR